MSIKNPILKVTRECPKCKGKGYKVIRVKYNHSHDYIVSPSRYCYANIDCKKCRGTGYIDVKQNNPKFKKYYQKELKEQVDYLITKYRTAKAKVFDIGEELGKHCKELDKVVNK